VRKGEGLAVEGQQYKALSRVRNSDGMSTRIHLQNFLETPQINSAVLHSLQHEKFK
jgi:hypothetical protein